MKSCKIENCENKHYAKGLCSKHYQRNYHNGDPLRLINEQHGMCRTQIYITWLDMKQRCYYSDDISYSNYGGRGIVVCDEWKDSFIAFYKDMGNKPFPKAQLDRIDNNGNYELDNCRWTTSIENNRNRPSCKLDIKKVRKIRELHGKVTAREIAKMFNISYWYVFKIFNGSRWPDKE